jgi:hypothetical protein
MHTFTSASTGSVGTAVIFKRAIARPATCVRIGGSPPCEAPDLPRIMEMSGDRGVSVGRGCDESGRHIVSFWQDWKLSFFERAHIINRRQHLKCVGRKR